MGGTGCISVTANVAPRLCAELQAAADAGEWERARQLGDRLHPLHLALFCGPSPAPTKYALHRLGVLEDPSARLPIGPLNEAGRACVDAALDAVGLLGGGVVRPKPPVFNKVKVVAENRRARFDYAIEEYVSRRASR